MTMKPGKFVGSGLNRKTAARPEMRPSRSSPNGFSGTQMEQFNRQAPEPFRNPAVGGSPLSRPVRKVGNNEGTAAPGTRPRSVNATQKISRPMSLAQQLAAVGEPRSPNFLGRPELTGYPTKSPARVGSGRKVR
jgi:hypothetical protein